MCCPGNASYFAGGKAVVEEQGYRMLLEIEAMRQDDKDMTWSRTLADMWFLMIGEFPRPTPP